MDLGISPPRQRAPRANSQFTRAALGIVQPTNRRIEQWQHRVALLDALSKQPARRAGEDLRSRTDELYAQVSAQHQAFLQEVASLPPKIAAESRIVDTRRALNTVLAAVQRVLDRLKPAAAE